MEINLEAKNTLLQQLNDKPLHILEIDFEILHSQVVYLPGMFFNKQRIIFCPENGGNMIFFLFDSKCTNQIT